MKKFAVIYLVFAMLLTLAGCGAGQEPLETWPITYNNMTMACYTRDYASVEEMLSQEHIIFRGKAVALVREGEMGVRLELEAIESTGTEKGSIVLLQGKESRFVLKKGEEVVLILFPTTEEGLYCIPNDNLGAFRIDEESGRVYCPRLDALLESAPQSYSAKGGKDLTLAQVYDLLVELDNSGE